MAALLLLERLTPAERAVLLLREVFGFGYPEVASAVGRFQAACRQLAVRARRHMGAGRPWFEAEARERGTCRAILRLLDLQVDRLGSAAARPGDQGGVDTLCLRSIRTQSGSRSVSLRDSEACTA